MYPNTNGITSRSVHQAENPPATGAAPNARASALDSRPHDPPAKNASAMITSVELVTTIAAWRSASPP